MAPRTQLISVVTPLGGKELTIKVRVARLWFMPPYNSNGPASASNGVEIQMVLCDRENNRIGASVKSIHLNKFKGVLHEGIVYLFSLFAVGHNGGSFRITSHPYKINFQFSTRVIPTVDDSSIHRFGFDWVSADSITSGQADPKTLVDMIGRLCNISDVIQSSKDDATSKRVTIEIEDKECAKLSVTLWGRYADQLVEFMKNYKDGPIVIALQWCKIKEFNGQRSLTNSMHATRILINEDLDEFMEFNGNLHPSDMKSPLNSS